MDKTALKAASKMLDEVPAYNEDAIQDYITRNKKAQSDLKAQINGPFSLSAFEYSEAGTVMEELKAKLNVAENYLQAVRDEQPVDIDSGYEEEFDLPSTVNRLAAQQAMKTYDMPQLDQFYAAKRAFTENIEPILVSGFEEFPRQQYMDAFNRFASLPAEELRRVIAQEFPKEEWIGKEPEAPADDTPTAEGEEGAPDPEDSFLDQEFGQGEWRNTLKNRQSARTSKSSKTSGSVPEQLRPYVGDNEDKDEDDDGKDEDQHVEHEKDSSLNWQNIYQIARNTSSAEEFKTAVENGEEKLRGGDLVNGTNKDPEPEEPFDNWFDSESGKGNGTPTGPDRDSRTSTSKLAAAMKLAEAYDIDADDALDLVEKVLEDE